MIKKWIKSGVLPLFSRESLNIPCFLANSLHVSIQSSDELKISNKMNIHVIISNISPYPNGNNSILNAMTDRSYGVIDLEKHNNVNDGLNLCLLSSVAFANMVIENNINFIEGLTKFEQEYNSSRKILTDRFCEKFEILSYTYLQSLGLIKSVEHISKKIKRSVIIFVKEQSKLKVYHVIRALIQISITPICLLLNDDTKSSHICNIFNTYQINTEQGKFCIICLRHFRKTFKYHKVV